jgi:hypothetical protein
MKKPLQQEVSSIWKCALCMPVKTRSYRAALIEAFNDNTLSITRLGSGKETVYSINRVDPMRRQQHDDQSEDLK